MKYQLKTYQQDAYDRVEKFLQFMRNDCEAAEAIRKTRAYFNPKSGDVPYYSRFGQSPTVCIRIPTGGGKTLLAVSIISNLLSACYRDGTPPFVVWLAPTITIKNQIKHELLNNAGYQQELFDGLGDHPEVLEMDETSLITKSMLQNKVVILLCVHHTIRVHDSLSNKEENSSGAHQGAVGSAVQSLGLEKTQLKKKNKKSKESKDAKQMAAELREMYRDNENYDDIIEHLLNKEHHGEIFLTKITQEYIQKSRIKTITKDNQIKEVPQLSLPDSQAGEVMRSLMNVLALLKPVVISDEAHGFVSDLSVEIMRDRLKPRLVLELSATPSGQSNILHSVTGGELLEEQMLKLPMHLFAYPPDSWQNAVQAALKKHEDLVNKCRIIQNQRYIRPIVLFQAEQIGKEADIGRPVSKGQKISVYHLVGFLQQHCGKRRDSIAIHISTRKELPSREVLMSQSCQIEYVITVNALAEGWDCPFAYILCSVKSSKKVESMKAVTQLMGRILRMPNAIKTTQEALNMSYMYVTSQSMKKVADAILQELENNCGFNKYEAKESLKAAIETLADEESGELTEIQDELFWDSIDNEINKKSSAMETASGSGHQRIISSPVTDDEGNEDSIANPRRSHRAAKASEPVTPAVTSMQTESRSRTGNASFCGISQKRRSFYFNTKKKPQTRNFTQAQIAGFYCKKVKTWYDVKITCKISDTMRRALQEDVKVTKKTFQRKVREFNELLSKPQAESEMRRFPKLPKLAITRNPNEVHEIIGAEMWPVTIEYLQARIAKPNFSPSSNTHEEHVYKWCKKSRQMKKYEITSNDSMLGSAYSRHISERDPKACKQDILSLLDRKTQVRSISQREKQTLLKDLVEDVLSNHQISIVWKEKHRLIESIKDWLNEATKEYYCEQFNQSQQSGNICACKCSECHFQFENHYNIPRHYGGSVSFKYHFYPEGCIGPMNDEELQCATAIDKLCGKKVFSSWIRNVESLKNSFWINWGNKKFYPDFIIELPEVTWRGDSNPRILIVEYKGSHLIDAEDTRWKSYAGERFALLSDGYCCFKLIQHADGSGLEDALQNFSTVR